ncbi:MAG TPA: hypothetical protein VKU41_31690 [Polyangiaceae bacterium]|nr:hypothetical protein [Polyangiaceae bacterium]
MSRWRGFLGCSLAWAIGSTLSGTPARAADIGPGEGPLSVEVHAFVSQGFILTTGNDYINADTTNGSFQFTEVGINFTKTLFTDKLRVGAQIFGQDLGPAGSFKAQMDWFYLDYHWQDWLGFRAGRLKIPYGFFNEFADIDSARVFVLLPQSIYPLQERNFLFAQNGAELYGFARSRSAGALEYRLYGGTVYIDPALVIPPGSTLQFQFNVPYILGGRLVWETPIDGLRVGATVNGIHLDSTAFIPPTTKLSLPNDSFAYLASADYVWRDLTATAEFGRGHTFQGSSNLMLQGTLSQTSEGGYGMLAYRAARWFQPGAYYSVYFPDVHDMHSRDKRQHDAAVTLRFDINDHWLVKLEGHYMQGTAALTSPLTATAPAATADRYWSAFFLKTTGYF